MLADTTDYFWDFTAGHRTTFATGDTIDVLQTTIEEPCPEQKRTRFYNLVCRLNNKLCVRESGDTCLIFDQYLQELKEEKENELKEAEELEKEKEDLFNEVKNENYYQ